MTANFAGSRNVDERRRRRLATNIDDLDALKGGTGSSRMPFSGSAGQFPRFGRRSHFPIRKALSRRLWKLWGVGLLTLAFGAGILGIGVLVGMQGESLGPGVAQMFDLSGSTAARYFGSLQLLVAGQLAAFIWWVRSRSQDDFSGRYRLWAWTSAAALSASVLVATDAHVAWSETVVWWGGIDFWKIDILCWLAPVAVSMGGLTWLLHRDMRDNRQSLIMLWLAVGTWTVAAAVALTGQMPLLASYGTLFNTGTVMLGQWFLLMSLLLHARFVVYLSSEPPKVRGNWFTNRLPKMSLSGLFQKRGFGSRASQKDERPSASTIKSGASKKSAISSSKTRAKRKPKQQIEDLVENDLSDVDSYDSEAIPKQRHKTTKKKQKSIRLDVPEETTYGNDDEQDELKGLSKRDRRKLRKEWAEQRRAKRMS